MKTKLKFLFTGVVVLMLVMGLATMTRPASADTNGCPAGNPTNRPISNLVGAYYTTNGSDATYFFNSFVDKNPSNGVPGLIEYCVYPSPLPDGGVTTLAIGDDSTPWTDPGGFDNFSFNRTNGNPSNIGLDGRMDYEMGTATWSGSVPANQVIVLHINDATECNALYDPDPADGTCFVLPGEKQNNAEPPTVSKDASGSYDDTFTWTLTKDVDNADVKTAGGAPHTFNYTVSVSHGESEVSNVKVTGTITVSNPNTDAINIDGITDQLSDNTTCTVTDGGAQSLPSGDTTFAYECGLGSVPTGDVTNTAAVSWSDQDISDGHLAAGSADFTTGAVSFAGNEIDTCVDVTDSLGGSLGTVCTSDANPTVLPYSKTFTDPAGTCTSHDNTATFTTNDTQTSGNSNTVTVTDCQGADLMVSKDANPTFKRTYNWDISKGVTPKLVEKVGGGTAIFNYTVNVNETGFTDSDWAVTGTITVTNPNDWEPVALTGVTDSIDNGGSCSITSGNPAATLAAGASTTLGYSCSFGSNPGSGTNTATASWDASAASTPNGSAQGTAPYDFANAQITPVNQTITVTDTFNGGTPTTLGTLTATDTQPYASASYQYSRNITIPTYGCTSYPNSATIVETGQSASQTVTVCGPAQTGALTIGFWKTTNGQNLIKTYCANTLDDYLAGLGSGSGPFADAAGKNCSQLATYVQGILSGASATNMNVMLKAQMMGTALDVWFSGPGWTSTKIGGVKTPSNFLSHNNLGTFNMDTTAVCPIVDNTTTGTATCLNNLPSTDAVASGAVSSSPMSMQAILNFAATTPSPFNGLTGSGSVWYGGNRTKQEILKNIFDQFNNQMAFGSF
jgi:hypothetical protein